VRQVGGGITQADVVRLDISGVIVARRCICNRTSPFGSLPANSSTGG
jgi:hypothetical protein